MISYYKYRENHDLKTSEISKGFWNSFVMYIKRLCKEEYFTKKFGNEDDHSNWLWGYSKNQIEDKITEELGIRINFFDDNEEIPETNDILSLVEFFYVYMAKPIEYVHNYHNEPLPSKFNVASARYEYTVHINQLFENRNHCYMIKSGKVKRVISEKLNSIYQNGLTDVFDEELDRLINRSFENFISVKDYKIDEALTLIANALERAKTLEGKDKRKSINEIISKIDTNDDIKNDISDLIKMTTAISNKYTIRHHEIDKLDIQSKAMKEFLYYNYMNIIKLLLSTYNINF